MFARTPATPPPVVAQEVAAKQNEVIKGALTPATEQVATAAQASITSAITFLIATLAFLGITGDGLERLIRNDPNPFVVAIALGLVGAIVPLADGLIKNRAAAGATIGTVVIQFIGTALLVAATIVALVWGSSNLKLRDQPHIDLTTTATTSGVLIAADAKTSSMLAGEKMLLMVATIDKSAASTAIDARNLCADQMGAFTDDEVTVLYWTETAPTVAGNASDQFQREVADPDAGYACASVFLFERVADCKPKPNAAKNDSTACLKPLAYTAVSVTDITTVGSPDGTGVGATDPTAATGGATAGG